MSEENTNVAPEAPSGGESLRDDVAKAFEQVESREAPPPADKATPTPARAPEGQPGERLRGPDGRYLAQDVPPKPAAAPPAAQQPVQRPATPPAAQKPPVAPPEATAQQLRPPTSWKPGTREHWGKLPAEVQQEVVRREAEVTRAMQEGARYREMLGELQSIVSPFAQNFASTEGGALGAIQGLLRADHTLRHGSVAEKAHLAANIIRGFGVDIATLDAVLAGQTPPNEPNAQLAQQLRQEMQQQLQPLMGFFNQVQGQRQQALQHINTNAVGEVEAFGQDAAHEFFDHVRNRMADIIDLNTARGDVISLQEAYDQATYLDPQIREIVTKRAEQERANAAAAAAQRARRTAASISSSPAPAGAVPGPANDDRRAAISAAWDDAANR